jgi:regulator of protease activity HflC (stomatin/prohibitin superfamily)
MRSEIGKLKLDQTFEERDKLNKLLLQELSEAVESWGVKCLRYEIKDIHVSDTIRKVMNLEAEAER